MYFNFKEKERVKSVLNQIKETELKIKYVESLKFEAKQKRQEKRDMDEITEARKTIVNRSN